MELHAAITIASTFWVMKSSMMVICPATSVSFDGPLKMTVAPVWRPAAWAPAFTVCQKS